MNEIREKISIRRYMYRMFAAVLLSGGFMFLISSCERAEDMADGAGEINLVPPAGEPFPVNFTISEFGFGESEAAVRSAASNIPETVVIPLTGELSMYATLEEVKDEEAVALRAKVPLLQDSKVRIVAYWGPSVAETCIGHADYEVVDNIGTLNPVGSPLSLSAGTYRFVAYSYHDAANMDALSDTTGFLSFQDVLWGDTIQLIGAGSNVDIRVHHLFSQVKIEAHLGASAGNLIDYISNTYVSTFIPRLIVKTGSLILDPPASPIDSIPVTWSTSTSAKPWISEFHYVHTRGSTPFLHINSVAVDGHTHPGPYKLTYPATTLDAGKSYILRIRFMKQDLNTTFARLTWEPHSATFPGGRYIMTTDPTDAGLYFKFGSVVGIFSGRDASNKGNIRRLPDTTTATAFDPTTDIAWNPTSTTITTWAQVPFYNGPADWPKEIVPDPTNPANDYHNPANIRLGKGDPCRLVGLNLDHIKNATNLTIADIDNGAWRLPTAAENAAFAATFTGSGHWWWDLIGGANPSVFGPGVAGGEFPSRNSDNGSPDPSQFLPAAGYRQSLLNGTVAEENKHGDYWSNAPSSAQPGVPPGNPPTSALQTNVQSLTFDRLSVVSPADLSAAYGFNVRCIRDPYLFITVERVGYTYGSYLLDASTYTLNVRSNSAWRIKSITGDTYNLPGGTINDYTPMLNLQGGDNLAVGTTGAGNPTTGEPVTFTVVKNKAIWGNMIITFESPLGLFADYTIEVMFAIRRVKIMGIGGADNTYAYNVAHLGTGPTANNSAQRMLATPANFGYSLTSKICARGFDYVGINYSPPASGSTSAANLIALHDPDIIVFSYPHAINQTSANTYRDFVVNKGGVIIALLEPNNPEYWRLVHTMLNDNTIGYNTGARPGFTAGSLYKINNVNDPITNGPFGDVRNKLWGEDASATAVLENLPPNVTIYSHAINYNRNTPVGYPNTTNPGVLAFRWNDYPFLFVGDGGFLSSYPNTNTDICPFKLDASFYPVPKWYGYYQDANNTRDYVYNSVFFANMMAWAITQIRD